MKTVNYTPEMTSIIVECYTETPTKEMVAALAERFGKTTRSIVAKLSREGVYQKAEYVTKQGTKPVAKESIVAEIADVLKVTLDQLGGMEKANKNALLLILTTLKAKQ